MPVSATPATVPSPRTTARRASASCAALTAALADSGCIVTSTEVSGAGCVVDLYDARSLSLAVDVIAAAARAAGRPELAARSAQSGPGAWTVTAAPQTWHGSSDRPLPAVSRSQTSWRLGIPGDDLPAVAACLIAA